MQTEYFTLTFIYEQAMIAYIKATDLLQSYTKYLTNLVKLKGSYEKTDIQSLKLVKLFNYMYEQTHQTMCFMFKGMICDAVIKKGPGNCFIEKIEESIRKIEPSASIFILAEPILCYKSAKGDAKVKIISASYPETDDATKKGIANYVNFKEPMQKINLEYFSSSKEDVVIAIKDANATQTIKMLEVLCFTSIPEFL